MKIGIASDHRGYQLKEEIKKSFLKDEIIDYGTNSTDTADYPDYAFLVAEAVRDKKIDFGVVICGSGIGMSIACNKVKKVRCARVLTKEDAKVTRTDNDANMIALNEKMTKEEAIEIIKTFVETPFSNYERYIRRLDKIRRYENER